MNDIPAMPADARNTSPAQVASTIPKLSARYAATTTATKDERYPRMSFFLSVRSVVGVSYALTIRATAEAIRITNIVSPSKAIMF